MVGVATWPVTSFVTARFKPWSMRKAARVIRKESMPVRVTKKPLSAPMASEIPSARNAPTHEFRCRL